MLTQELYIRERKFCTSKGYVVVVLNPPLLPDGLDFVFDPFGSNDIPNHIDVPKLIRGCHLWPKGGVTTPNDHTAILHYREGVAADDLSGAMLRFSDLVAQVCAERDAKFYRNRNGWMVPRVTVLKPGEESVHTWSHDDLERERLSHLASVG